ncbi:MAG: phosphatase PAP2 family protein [Myxococcales bacterium]|nr:phosphatase PAP2 family protein [Myxococcales bacterium]MDP3504719.1 phosphatase PAP2 family protein [Myxococcales bacterium]
MSAPAASGLVDIRWGWDESLFHAINGLGWAWLDVVWVVTTSRPFGIAVTLVFAAWLAVRLKRQVVLPLAQLGAAIAVTDALGARVIKPAIGRARPSFVLADELVRVLVPASNVGSMPSLHSANAFAVATVVTLTYPRAGLAAFPVAFLIGVSRVGVGVHWPSDVLAGAVYGSSIGALIVFGARAALALRSRSSTLEAKQHGEPHQPDRP